MAHFFKTDMMFCFLNVILIKYLQKWVNIKGSSLYCQCAQQRYSAASVWAGVQNMKWNYNEIITNAHCREDRALKWLTTHIFQKKGIKKLI